MLTFFLRFQLAPRIPLDGVSTLRKNSKSGGILVAKRSQRRTIPSAPFGTTP